jgi:hypothetical protein
MDSLPNDWMEQLRAIYPKRTGGQGWGALPRLVHRALAAGATWPQLLAGAASYARYCSREGLIGTGYVKQVRTFFGPDNWWQESYEEEAKPKLPQELALERRWDSLKQRGLAAGFRQPFPIESPDVYETALKFHERGVTTLRRTA